MTPGQMGGAPSAPKKVESNVVEADMTYVDNITQFVSVMSDTMLKNPGKDVKGVFSFSEITFKGKMMNTWFVIPGFLEMLQDEIMKVHAVGMMGDKKEIEVNIEGINKVTVTRIK